MCDYSLMGIPNRLAEEGEVLVTHRFSTGSLGFASPSDLCKTAHPARPRGVWSGSEGKSVQSSKNECGSSDLHSAGRPPDVPRDSDVPTARSGGRPD